jgi:molybdopterin synthase sulfur carrier subunit
MKVTLKYFGLIADLVKTNEEIVDLSVAESTTDGLMQILNQKYPDLLNTNFAIAINQSIITSVTSLSNEDIIALMPPFAGG